MTQCNAHFTKCDHTTAHVTVQIEYNQSIHNELINRHWKTIA